MHKMNHARMTAYLAIAGLLLFYAAIAMAAPANDNGRDNDNAKNPDIERVDFIHYAKPSNHGAGQKTV
ncbi:MAG: hypothetical protein PHG85_01460 [Candidatus Altiarchaeota archaeon]|nr:hypothetical protein [Candidatus Altiarchaeota archaeon]